MGTEVICPCYCIKALFSMFKLMLNRKLSGKRGRGFSTFRKHQLPACCWTISQWDFNSWWTANWSNWCIFFSFKCVFHPLWAFQHKKREKYLNFVIPLIFCMLTQGVLQLQKGWISVKAHSGSSFPLFDCKLTTSSTWWISSNLPSPRDS